MTAKEYLRRPLRAYRQLELALEQFTRLRALAEKTTSTLDDMPRAQPTGGSRMESAALAVIEQKTILAAAIDNFLTQEKEVTAAIAKLPDLNEHIVLFLRYIGGLKWRDVATAMNLSESRVYKLHQRALQNMATAQI